MLHFAVWHNGGGFRKGAARTYGKRAASIKTQAKMPEQIIQQDTTGKGQASIKQRGSIFYSLGGPQRSYQHIREQAAHHNPAKTGAKAEDFGMFGGLSHMMDRSGREFWQKRSQRFQHILLFLAERELGQLFLGVPNANTDDPGFTAPSQPCNGRLDNLQCMDAPDWDGKILFPEKTIMDHKFISLTVHRKLVKA